MDRYRARTSAQGGARPLATRLLSLAFLVVASVAGAPLRLGAQEPSAQAPQLEVDRERSEVRVPVLFVNPSRQIEVFACHRRGPTHETVLKFDTDGQALYDALRAIGCRVTDAWNATSPSDFLRNQGDRVLVLVRWEHDGEMRELPAEFLLEDGETGFISFLRGFSFSAFDVEAYAAAVREAREESQGDGDEGAEGEEEARGEDAGAATRGRILRPNQGAGIDGDEPQDDEQAPPPFEAEGPLERGEVPQAVEITLGATRRERATFSLLIHPTSLRGTPPVEGAPPTRALQYWTLPPVVSAHTLPELQELVRRQVPATLVFRRIESELEILDYARSAVSRIGESRRLPLYDELAPIARRIDALKALYRADVDEIQSLLALDREAFLPETYVEFESRGEMLRRRGQWLCASIQELYFTMYLRQQEFEVEALRGSAPASPEEIERLRVLTESGLRYEVEIAEKERVREAASLAALRTTEEIRRLELARDRDLYQAKKREILARIEKLAADPNSAYIVSLLREDVARVDNLLGALGWRERYQDATLEELRVALEGDLTQEAARLTRLRKTATEGLRLAKLRMDLIDLDESIRWYRRDLEDESVSERHAEARQKLDELGKERADLVSRIEAAERELQNLEPNG